MSSPNFHTNSYQELCSYIWATNQHTNPYNTLGWPVMVPYMHDAAIFSKTTKISRARRASAICSLWKNSQVLIYSKLHEKNHVITFLIIYMKKFEMVKQKKPTRITQSGTNCTIIAPSRARAWFENNRFDWLSVNFFVHWPIKMLALLPFLHSITSFLHCVKEKLHCPQPIRIE